MRVRPTPLLTLVACVLLATTAGRGQAKKRHPAKKSAFKATVKPPGYAAIQRLVRSAELPDVRAHGRGKPIGGARFVSVVSSQKTRKVFIVVVEKQKGKWKLLHRLLLPRTPPPDKRSDPCDADQSPVSAVVFAGDYDRDGKPEAYARHLYCYVVPAIGDAHWRRMFIVNLDGEPRIALSADYGMNALPTAMGARHVRARFRDVDKDGHPDVVLTERFEDPDKGMQKPSRTIYLWKAASDSYERRTPHASARRRRKKR